MQGVICQVKSLLSRDKRTWMSNIQIPIRRRRDAKRPALV